MVDAMQSLRVGAVYLALTFTPAAAGNSSASRKLSDSHRDETAKRMFSSSECLTSEQITSFFSRWVLTCCQSHAPAVSDKDE